MHSDLTSETDRIVRVLHRVKLESNYNKALWPVLVEELLVARHLFLAGLAPRRPKTDQYHLFDLMFAHRWDFLVKLVRVLPGLCR